MVFKLSGGSGRPRTRRRSNSSSTSSRSSSNSSNPRSRSSSNSSNPRSRSSSNSSSTSSRRRSNAQGSYLIKTKYYRDNHKKIRLVLNHSYKFPGFNNRNYKFVGINDYYYTFEGLDSEGKKDVLKYVLSSLQHVDIEVPTSGGKTNKK